MADAVSYDALDVALKRLRATAGLTQEELAGRAGISARTVSDVERGLRTAIHGETARRLASARGLRDEDRARFDAVARGRGASSWAGCATRRLARTADAAPRPVR